MNINKTSIYIYHYYFNIYGDKKPIELLVRKEKCIIEKRTNSFLQEVVQYRILSKHGRHAIKAEQFNTVVAGRSVYMMERNDKLALELFNNYMQDKINNIQTELEKAITLYDTVNKKSKFKYEVYDSEEK